MMYPTLEQAKEADSNMIQQWFGGLSTPSNSDEHRIMELIVERYIRVCLFANIQKQFYYIDNK